MHTITAQTVSAKCEEVLWEHSTSESEMSTKIFSRQKKKGQRMAFETMGTVAVKPGRGWSGMWVTYSAHQES